VQPRRGMFVRRNRIIAGLARATLIVEAGLPSGTFSTADAALAVGRDVLVVPGSIHSPESRGSNRLLQQGAYPVVDLETFDQVLSSLFPVLVSEGDVGGGRSVAGLSSEQGALVRMLAADPMRAEDIARHMGLDASHAVMLISECEAFGIIERFRDGRYGVPVSGRRQAP
jgi:DNA processing protein